MNAVVHIGGRPVGRGAPCFVIAEVGVNHNGDVELAERLVDAAAAVGADAVKFQSFRAERLASLDAPKADYQLETTSPGESQLEMLRKLELGAGAHERLVHRCRERGVFFLSSPFDEESVDLLVELDVPAIKIPSPDLTNPILLERAARTGKPLIVSTGMATLEEVERALATVAGANGGDVVLLHCVSTYPAAPDEANLRAMATMRGAFGVPVGFSDHTLGIDVALAAVALGASVLEKHVTLDRTLPGPDHRSSLEPDELASLLRGVRAVESALGDGVKAPSPAEASTRAIARRSLAAKADIPAGTVLTRELVTALRPGTGIPADRLAEIVGRTVTRDLRRGELFTPAVLE